MGVARMLGKLVGSSIPSLRRFGVPADLPDDRPPDSGELIRVSAEFFRRAQAGRRAGASSDSYAAAKFAEE
ncbi:MAG: hypothetical protein HOH36_17695 [Acidimicrobiaceae bacterium]|nr:hypothetical protein [Acidimicrobiaceae bacterium]MBT5579288.1 hypothetical protein [Acidimicrobiaceae bacterium]MBT5852265.1 hypothetical protein [Acidimicrobiaceae bacterium]